MQERDAYLPLAEKGSKLFFVISDLCKINNMYRFSLASFLSLFQRALHNKQVCTDFRDHALYECIAPYFHFYLTEVQAQMECFKQAILTLFH